MRVTIERMIADAHKTGYGPALCPPLEAMLLALASRCDAIGGAMTDAPVTAAGGQATHTHAVGAGGLSPLDRDGDGRPGGSLPAAERLPAELLQRAEDLKIDVDLCWGEETLRAAIAEAEAAAAAAAEVPAAGEGQASS